MIEKNGTVTGPAAGQEVEPARQAQNPRVMKFQRMLLACLLALPCLAHSAEVYRWVDDFGRWVYGTEVPERHRHRAEPASAPLPRGTNACEARWHRYLASAACFDQYRVVRGGLKPEAYQRCTEVPQPEPCT